MTTRGRARRAAQRAPAFLVRQASSGDLVRIVGRVEYADEPLVAPFSGRPCAHYEAAVEYPMRSGTFRRTLVESESRPFYVSDDSGRALVDMSRAIVEVVIDHYWEAQETDAETRFELERFLYRTGDRGLSHLRDSAALRYAEGAIEQGETVSVVGMACFDRASETGTGYRDGARRLTIEAPPRGALFVSDGLHWS